VVRASVKERVSARDAKLNHTLLWLVSKEEAKECSPKGDRQGREKSLNYY